MQGILNEAIRGSINSIKQIAIIVVPLMIFMEILKDVGVFDKMAQMLSPVVKLFGMEKEAGFPLVIGIIIGLSYGAGIIIQSTKKGQLTHRDLHLLTYFLVAAHAVIEDTALFMAVGVNGVLILATRLAVAVAITFLASRLTKPNDESTDFTSEVSPD